MAKSPASPPKSNIKDVCETIAHKVRMNDPEPSSSDPDNTVDSPSDISSAPDTTQPAQNWFMRVTQGWLSRLTNTSLRSQMEGALAHDEGGDEAFSAEEKAMLRNILAMRELRVDDVMVPRADIDAVEDEITLGALLAIYQDVGHSRLPVYRETLDDPIGMVHIKDVVELMTKECCIGSLATNNDIKDSAEALELLDVTAEQIRESDVDGNPLPKRSNHPQTLANVDLERPLRELGVIRDILFVPPSMPAMDLMASMRAARTQMALVIDEYGGTDGLVSLEDVVETVVGDIEDEHDDEDEVYIASAGNNLFIADAKADLEEVIQTIGMPLPLDEDESMEEVDTLGGFIFTHIGRIPVRGELIAVSDGLEFEIMEADRRRIRRVKIRLKPTKKSSKRAHILSNDHGTEEGVEQPEDINLQEKDSPNSATG